MEGSEAYLYSLEKYKNTGSELWLMTALSKAEPTSTQLQRMLDAADRSSRTSAAYPTIAYHAARILLAQGKHADARKVIDHMLSMSDQIPISTQNSFLDLKRSLAETLDDFLRSSLKRPFAFDFEGTTGTIDEFIEEQKTWFDPETNKEGREAYEAEIHERFRKEKLWQGRWMFDSETIQLFNEHFPTAVLIDVMNSPVLPDYLRERFAIAVWTRAYLLGDTLTWVKVIPEVTRDHPELAPLLDAVKAAKTRDARDKAALFFLIKNPMFSPYVQDGFGKTDNEFNEWDSNDWWCSWDDGDYETSDAAPVRFQGGRPRFLSVGQAASARSERKKLNAIGDAPKYLAMQVIDWARRSPADKRVPEAIYLMIGANGWTKYGCGNNEDLRNELMDILRKRYPKSEWTAKLAADESDR